MPDNTVSVTRPGKWGNPFIVGNQLTDLPDSVSRIIRFTGEEMDANVITPKIAVDAFKIWITFAYAADSLRDSLHELTGKNLACWCKIGEPCHADVLLELANPK